MSYSQVQNLSWLCFKASSFIVAVLKLLSLLRLKLVGSTKERTRTVTRSDVILRISDKVPDIFVVKPLSRTTI